MRWVGLDGIGESPFSVHESQEEGSSGDSIYISSLQAGTRYTHACEKSRHPQGRRTN